MDKTRAVELALEELDKFVRKPLSGHGATGGDQGRYGCISTKESYKGEKSYDGFYIRSNQHPCHYYLSTYRSPVVLFNQYSHRKSLSWKAFEKYFDFITDNKGPWRKFSNRLKTELPEGTEQEKRDFILNNGWVWTDLDIPSNLQHSFLTAARSPGEWPELITRWYSWVKEGIDESVAYFFLTLFNGSGKKYVISSQNKYDWPLDVCTSGEEYFRNFHDGKIEKLNPFYSKNQSYTPVNRIFGVNNLPLTNKDRYASQLFERYHKSFGASEKECKKSMQAGNSLATFDYSKFWWVSEVELISIMKLETERLF